MTTYADVAGMLEPLGLSVIMPGDPVAALPCITLEPVQIEVNDGSLLGWERANIVIRYPLDANNTDQWSECNEKAYGALRALVGHRGVIVAADVLFGSNPTSSQPDLAYTLDVSFPGPYAICGPEPEPEPEVDAD